MQYLVCNPQANLLGYIHIKEILDLLKEQKYPGKVIVELYDYSPEHMLEGIGESVSWVAGVLRE